MKEPYRPLYGLPLEIRSSAIDGQGLFATADLAAGQVLGPCHFDSPPYFERLPIGGWINFSDTPNCERRFLVPPYWTLFTKLDIAAGEELTLRYLNYNPEDVQ